MMTLPAREDRTDEKALARTLGTSSSLSKWSATRPSRDVAIIHLATPADAVALRTA